MLDALTRDLRAASPASLTRAARRAYTLAFLTLAVPGVPLGAVLALWRPLDPGGAGQLISLVALAAALAGVALYLAGRTARDPSLRAPHGLLAAAIQRATAPAVPFLIGCAFLRSGVTVALLWGLALLLFLVGRPPAVSGPVSQQAG